MSGIPFRRLIAARFDMASYAFSGSDETGPMPAIAKRISV